MAYNRRRKKLYFIGIMDTEERLTLEVARFLRLAPTFRDNSMDIVINLFLFSQHISFLCVISRVNFTHFEILAPLSR